MRPPATGSPARLLVRLLLQFALLMQASFAASQELPSSPQPQLTAVTRSRLTEAAADWSLEPWQREFMLEMARGEPERVAAAPSPALPSVALRTTGTAANDGGWSALAPSGSPPSTRYGHTAIYDPVRDRMVVFGGSAGIYLNDLWALSLAGSPAWSALAAAGSPPPARSLHSAIYDPVRDRMVVFGGNSGSFRNDVWALSLAGSTAWSALAPTGSPPLGRYGHTALYDPVRDRMVVFGGVDTGSWPNDVWVLSLGGTPAWSALVPSGSPPIGRYRHSAIYDPVRDRMVVFGGNAGDNRNDVWALSLPGGTFWGQITPAGSPPSARYGHSAIYDPVRDRMVVFGGNDGSYPNDVRALSLAGSPAWSALAPAGSPPPGRDTHAAIYDPARDRMVLFGGNAGVNLNDVWALWWGVAVTVPGDADAHPHRFEISPARPNPSRGETTVEFELAEPARVVLDVFDVRGRRVKRIADEWFTAGRHVSTWRGQDDRGLVVGSGVYFIRMDTGGFHATRRMVRMR